MSSETSKLDSGLSTGTRLVGFLASGVGLAILLMVFCLMSMFCLGLFMVASAPV
jgi:tetrahydromethanopterin S-methyltransferase subunit F